MTEETHEEVTKDIKICSLCGSRTGPFLNVVQGGSYTKILGCACPVCRDLDGKEWKDAVTPLLAKGQAETMIVRYSTKVDR